MFGLKMMSIILVICLLVHGSRATFTGAVKEAVCSPQDITDSNLPPVPSSFITRMEITYEVDGKNKLVNGLEMFDAKLNRGRIDYQFGEGQDEGHPFLVSEEIHYDINADEALFVLSDKSCEEQGAGDCETSETCEAGKISDLSAEIQQLFGLVQIPGESGFYGASGILQFGPEFNYTKTMAMDCRGVVCDLYDACLEKPEENATVKYTYAWTTPDWLSETQNISVPVFVEIMSSSQVDGHTSKPISMRIDFFDFQSNVRPSYYVLQPPASAYCLNRVSNFTPPELPPMFSFSAEHILGYDKNVLESDGTNYTLKIRAAVDTKEFYDNKANISRIEHLGISADENTRYEMRQTTVNDFNSGFSYHIYPELLVCNVTLIQSNVSWGAVHVNDDGSVSMVTSDHIMDVTLPYLFNGKHYERNMETLVWTGVKKNEQWNVNETFVWYFGSGESSILAGRASANINRNIPIKLEKYITIREDLPHSVMNIYAFDSQTPHTHLHDISLCFTPQGGSGGEISRHFTLDFPGDSLQKVDGLEESFLYAVQMCLANTGNLSPIRINKIEIDSITDDRTRVLFTLLNRTVLTDSNGEVTASTAEADLDTAESAIRSSVDGDQFIIDVSVHHFFTTNVTSVKLSAVAKTLKETSRTEGNPHGSYRYDTGYTSGSMTGLAFGMILVGFCMAMVGLAFYEKQKLKL